MNWLDRLVARSQGLGVTSAPAVSRSADLRHPANEPSQPDGPTEPELTSTVPNEIRSGDKQRGSKGPVMSDEPSRTPSQPQPATSTLATARENPARQATPVSSAAIFPRYEEQNVATRARSAAEPRASHRGSTAVGATSAATVGPRSNRETTTARMAERLAKLEELAVNREQQVKGGSTNGVESASQGDGSRLDAATASVTRSPQDLSVTNGNVLVPEQPRDEVRPAPPKDVQRAAPAPRLSIGKLVVEVTRAPLVAEKPLRRRRGSSGKASLHAGSSRGVSARARLGLGVS